MDEKRNEKYRAFHAALQHYLSMEKDGNNIDKTKQEKTKTQQHLMFTRKQRNS